MQNSFGLGPLVWELGLCTGTIKFDVLMVQQEKQHGAMGFETIMPMTCLQICLIILESLVHIGPWM